MVFTAVKAAADIASNPPKPITDRLITVISPKETAATKGRVACLPCDEAYAITVITVGPGITSMIADAVTNASHSSIAIMLATVVV
jgi:hypothetical protein